MQVHRAIQVRRVNRDLLDWTVHLEETEDLAVRVHLEQMAKQENQDLREFRVYQAKLDLRVFQDRREKMEGKGIRVLLDHQVPREKQEKTEALVPTDPQDLWVPEVSAVRQVTKVDQELRVVLELRDFQERLVVRETRVPLDQLDQWERRDLRVKVDLPDTEARSDSAVFPARRVSTDQKATPEPQATKERGERRERLDRKASRVFLEELDRRD